MKKIYLHLMALMCLLLFGGVNAWATVHTWETNSNDDSDTFYKFQNKPNQYIQIGSTPVDFMYTHIPGTNQNSAYDKTYRKGLTICYSGSSYLRTNNTGGGYVTLYLEAVNDGIDTHGNEYYISVKDNGTVVASCSPKERTQTRNVGTKMSFKMEQNKTYELVGSTYGYIKKLVFYTSDEVDEIILDENASKATNDSKATATYTKNYKFVSTVRTLKSSIWNTFCLPINFSHQELQDYFRCSAVYEMSGYSSTDYQIAFTQKNSYTGGKPCLVMPLRNMVNPSFITTSSLSPSTTSGSGSDLMFVGVYGTENIFTTGDEHSTKFYLNTNSYLVYPENDPSNIKGLRAYFEWASAPVKNLSVSFDGIETGIKMVEKDIFQENGNVYSIDGRFVGNSTDNLTRGIYIQNGRKFVVK